MNSQQRSRDQEQISAYLDGVLSERDFAQFKTRLGAETDLAAAVREMERTRSALRRAPQRRAPRSFALTQQMVSAQRASLFSSWNLLSFASAFATLLLAFVLIGDFSVNGLPIAGLAAPEAPQALMAEVATDDATQVTPEAELYAQADRQTKGAETALDWNMVFTQYARELELGLGGIAVISGWLAWRQKNRQK